MVVIPHWLDVLYAVLRETLMPLSTVAGLAQTVGLAGMCEAAGMGVRM